MSRFFSRIYAALELIVAFSPVSDVKSFVGLSQVLEGVGTSAYAGAASFLTSKDALNAAAVILSTEARHAAWVASAVNKQNPWSGAYDVCSARVHTFFS